MTIARTPLLDQSPVPVDWPTRIGYPPPGVRRVRGYPAGKSPVLHTKHRHRRLFREAVRCIDTQSIHEDDDLIQGLDRSAAALGPSHPTTLRYLKAAMKLMRPGAGSDPDQGPLTAAERLKVKTHLMRSTHAQLATAKHLNATSMPWSQTASVDVDLNRALIEGLLRWRFEDGCVDAAARQHRAVPSESDPQINRHFFRSHNDRRRFIHAIRKCGHNDVLTRDHSTGFAATVQVRQPTPVELAKKFTSMRHQVDADLRRRGLHHDFFDSDGDDKRAERQRLNPEVHVLRKAALRRY